jgi:hypothetical protein
LNKAREADVDMQQKSEQLFVPRACPVGNGDSPAGVTVSFRSALRPRHLPRFARSDEFVNITAVSTTAHRTRRHARGSRDERSEEADIHVEGVAHRVADDAQIFHIRLSVPKRSNSGASFVHRVKITFARNAKRILKRQSLSYPRKHSY